MSIDQIASVAVIDISTVSTRGQGVQPWLLIRAAVASRLGVPADSIAIEDIAVSPADFGRLREDSKVFLMLQGRSPSEVDLLPSGRAVRGANNGSAYVKAVLS